MTTLTCTCHKCIAGKRNERGIPLSLTFTVVCSECGYKRCPKASDHTLACTKSNKPGQPGSIYGARQDDRL